MGSGGEAGAPRRPGGFATAGPAAEHALVDDSDAAAEDGGGAVAVGALAGRRGPAAAIAVGPRPGPAAIAGGRGPERGPRPNGVEPTEPSLGGRHPDELVDGQRQRFEIHGLLAPVGPWGRRVTP